MKLCLLLVRQGETFLYTHLFDNCMYTVGLLYECSYLPMYIYILFIQRVRKLSDIIFLITTQFIEYATTGADLLLSFLESYFESRLH